MKRYWAKKINHTSEDIRTLKQSIRKLSKWQAKAEQVIEILKQRRKKYEKHLEEIDELPD